MGPHRQVDKLLVVHHLFNRKLNKGWRIVKNAFVLLKLFFQELHKKSDLHLTFVPDVVIYCVILHNMILKQFQEDIDHWLGVLRQEGGNEIVGELVRS